MGNAIKTLGLPRDELVVMTKVRPGCVDGVTHYSQLSCKIYYAVPDDKSVNAWTTSKTPAEFGIINQHGMNRKVGTCIRAMVACLSSMSFSIYLILSRRACSVSS